jgi:SlyX protein
LRDNRFFAGQGFGLQGYSVKSMFYSAGILLVMEDRLAQLESKLCLAEDLLDTLNVTVFRQQQQIDQLQAQIRVLYQQMQNSSGTGAEKRDLRDEIPPHY